MVCKKLSHILLVAFSFCYFFYYVETFKFDVVPLVDFLLLLHIQKNHCQIKLSLFSDDMILYIENFKDSIKRLL